MCALDFSVDDKSTLGAFLEHTRSRGLVFESKAVRAGDRADVVTDTVDHQGRRLETMEDGVPLRSSRFPHLRELYHAGWRHLPGIDNYKHVFVYDMSPNPLTADPVLVDASMHSPRPTAATEVLLPHGEREPLKQSEVRGNVVHYDSSGGLNRTMLRGQRGLISSSFRLALPPLPPPALSPPPALLAPDR